MEKQRCEKAGREQGLTSLVRDTCCFSNKSLLIASSPSCSQDQYEPLLCVSSTKFCLLLLTQSPDSHVSGATVSTMEPVIQNAHYTEPKRSKRNGWHLHKESSV
ncbi:hypothetical protein KIL84_015056 [Mauremys mutica]|uniref:Uncharacterized protein n=1 Tax=Mauremys mutica TaxID=74926 RepID=A0A9D4B8J3_9SAUR|nr:hypothetical protein KIL84_015056 [Mauremys mutica]